MMQKSRIGGCMASTTVLEGGRVTIPLSVRQSLGLGPGDRVMFVRVGSGCYELLAVTNSVTDLKGLLRKPPNPVTLAEMDAAVFSQVGLLGLGSPGSE
ncbi:AbrB/MazE/SpoVT family DNA-binding domain-containing protein [Uliginosibacterium sp. TH139]|uniref:AbrB/MazE/SpoVT family DNA-binding domain-containing protein n=1 Tax=Uliginosibacterium sp. TH139 TaxID=2067453 RepID=UPI000C7D33FE|nr:AbrB family transcriptional regulator [Uliginosibacterium sp. TH139]